MVVGGEDRGEEGGQAGPGEGQERGAQATMAPEPRNAVALMSPVPEERKWASVPVFMTWFVMLNIFY